MEGGTSSFSISEQGDEGGMEAVSGFREPSMEEVSITNEDAINRNGGVGEMPSSSSSPRPSQRRRATTTTNMTTATTTTPHGPPPERTDSMLSLPKKQSGIFGASSNLVNSIVGAGIVGIPYAVRQSGFVAGLVLLFLVGFLTDRSLQIIVNLASFHPVLKGKGVRTFEGLASFPFGRLGSGFVLANMFVMAYGAMVAYMIIIKDTVPTVLGIAEGSIAREVILVITTLFIVVPLSMMRDMASLSFTSLMSVTADIILVGFVAAYAPIGEAVSGAGGFGQVLTEAWIRPGLFIGLGIISTAMACQHSSFIVSGSLSNKTQRRWSIVTGASLSFATLLCVAMGVCGYLGFLDGTRGDVLNNFSPEGVVSNGARMLLAITMFFTYPMESFVARHVLIILLHQGDMDAADNDSGREGGGYFCLNRKQSWTMALYIAALIPGLFLDDLGPVLSITGSLGGSCVAYIAPGLIYLGVNGDAFQDMCRAMAQNWTRKHDDSKEKETSHDGAGAAGLGDIELPVAGDADQRISPDAGGASPAANGSNSPAGPADLPLAGEKRTLSTRRADFEKPFWWYLGLFPIWWAIASSGSAGMRDKLSNLVEEEESSTMAPAANVEGGGRMPNGNSSSDIVEDHFDLPGDEYPPTKEGFFLAIFFILFGVLGVVVGLVSNVAAHFSGPNP